MNAKAKLYSTLNDVIEHEILPLIPGFEQDFDVEYLADNLVAHHLDENGYLKGFGVKQVTDEEFVEIFTQAAV